MMNAKSKARPAPFDASPVAADEVGSPLSRMAQRLEFGTASTSERGAFVGEKHAVRNIEQASEVEDEPKVPKNSNIPTWVWVLLGIFVAGGLLFGAYITLIKRKALATGIRRQ